MAFVIALTRTDTPAAMEKHLADRQEIDRQYEFQSAALTKCQESDVIGGSSISKTGNLVVLATAKALAKVDAIASTSG